jgi:hypothetical protein
MARFPFEFDRPRSIALAISLQLVVGATAALADPQPLTTCGQTVSGAYYLAADLDCTGVSGHGVAFRGYGQLDLRGFTLSNAENDGVECFNMCRIVGPGAIVGSASHGVRAPHGVELVGVTISGNNGPGVVGTRVKLADCVVTNNGFDGVSASRRAILVNTTVSGNDENGVVTDGAVFGGDRCRMGATKLVNSSVTGNSQSVDCGVGTDCADLVACRRPRVDDPASCETSRNVTSGDTWGVCADD